ncbi:MAG: hypothetical protein NT007_01320 [Candidatus Kapabacteria bacterium]|nr:hypothetical protein [Candidatus Kapabacteria bacterium]
MKNEPTKPLQSKFKKVEIEKTDDANNSSSKISSPVSEPSNIQKPEVTMPSHNIEGIAATEPKEVTPEDAELILKNKIKALRRGIENKKASIERENLKIAGWRKDAADRDSKHLKEYESRKSELEEALRKTEERYQKRVSKTAKLWWEYCSNREQNLVKNLNNDLTMMQNELERLERKEPQENQETK